MTENEGPANAGSPAVIAGSHGRELLAKVKASIEECFGTMYMCFTYEEKVAIEFVGDLDYSRNNQAGYLYDTAFEA